jgi:hypothetical protein
MVLLRSTRAAGIVLRAEMAAEIAGAAVVLVAAADVGAGAAVVLAAVVAVDATAGTGAGEDTNLSPRIFTDFTDKGIGLLRFVAAFFFGRQEALTTGGTGIH